MAINRADILSRQFELPQPVEQAATARASAPAAPTMDSKYFGIPDPAEGLQWTDNTAELANRYYQRLAGIDQFAKSMWLNNKIDVTKPDYSNPQSIAASQAYQQELGNIMAIADELKQGSKALEAANTAQMAGTYAVNEEALNVPGKGYASFTPEQRGYSLNVDPQLKFIQENTNRVTETQNDYNRLNKQAADTVARYKQIYEQTGKPEDLRNYESALRGLGATFNVQSPNSGFGTGTTFGLINNANVLGGGDSFYVPTTQLDDNGKPILVNKANDFINIPLGSGVVTELKRANGKTYLVNDKGYEEEVRPDNIYKYLVMAAKKTNQDRELEIEFKKLVDQGKVKWDKTNLTYTPVGLTVDELMSELGKAEKKRLEESLPDYKEQVERVKQNLISQLTQIKEFNKKTGWFSRVDAPLATSWTPWGENIPKFKIKTNSPLKQIEVTPAPYSKAEEDFIQLKVIDNAGTQLAHLPKGAKEPVPGLFKFKTIDEAVNFLKKEFGIFDIGAEIQEIPLGQQATTQQPSTSQTDW